MGKHVIFSKVVQFTAISLVTIVGFISIIATGGSKVETSRIDCDIDKITITSTLVGTVSVSGDMITGNLTVNCDGSGVEDVTIKGSAGWWNIVEVGPSDPNGVISVSRPAEALGNSDIGTTKSVDIIVNGYDASGNEASKVITINIPIS